MEESKITVETTIQASLDIVWECYTAPEHIVNWNFASPDWHCPSAVNNLKPGGLYRARMEARDGSMGFDFDAVYDEVMNREKLSYTMADGRQSVTTFEPAGDAVKVTTVFDAEHSNPLEMQQNGWQAILDNFKTYTEKQPG